MKVFLTGATGYIGSAVAETFRAAGHELTALVRPASDSARLKALGCAIVDGDLQSLKDLRGVIAAHDTIIHTASSSSQVADDAAAIDAFLSPRDSEAMFLYTSGVWVFGGGGDGIDDETSELSPLPIVAWRPAHEQRVLKAASNRFVTAVLRPGCVYGGAQSMMRPWFTNAEAGMPLQIVGDGSNHWSLVDRRDLAELYLRLAESRHRGIAHATDDSYLTLNECAAAVIRAAGSKSTIEHLDLNSARKTMGPFADALAVDQHISSRKTRERTGWKPRRGNFIGSITEQWEEWLASK